MADLGALGGASSGAMQGASIGASAGPFGALVGGIAGAGLGLFGALSGADQREKELKESLRRMRLTMDRTLSSAQVAVGATEGVAAGSTTLGQYVSGLTAEMDREYKWAEQAGLESAANISKAGALGAASDFASALFRFGKNNNWWQTPTTD
jgi:gas vesicle protein